MVTRFDNYLKIEGGRSLKNSNFYVSLFKVGRVIGGIYLKKLNWELKPMHRTIDRKNKPATLHTFYDANVKL